MLLNDTPFLAHCSYLRTSTDLMREVFPDVASRVFAGDTIFHSATVPPHSMSSTMFVPSPAGNEQGDQKIVLSCAFVTEPHVSFQPVDSLTKHEANPYVVHLNMGLRFSPHRCSFLEPSGTRVNASSLSVQCVRLSPSALQIRMVQGSLNAARAVPSSAYLCLTMSIVLFAMSCFFLHHFHYRWRTHPRHALHFSATQHNG